MTQLAEKQKPSIDLPQNNQFDVTKLAIQNKLSDTSPFAYVETSEPGWTGGAVDRTDGHGQAVSFSFNDKGDLVWEDFQQRSSETVDDPALVSLIVVRQDGSVERLSGDGVEDNKITNLTPQDEMLVVPDVVIADLQKQDLFTKTGIDNAIEEDALADYVRVSLDGMNVPVTSSGDAAAVVQTPVRMTGAEKLTASARRQQKRLIEKEMAARKARAAAPILTVASTADTDMTPAGSPANQLAVDPAAIFLDDADLQAEIAQAERNNRVADPNTLKQLADQRNVHRLAANEGEDGPEGNITASGVVNTPAESIPPVAEAGNVPSSTGDSAVPQSQGDTAEQLPVGVTEPAAAYPFTQAGTAFLDRMKAQRTSGGTTTNVAAQQVVQPDAAAPAHNPSDDYSIMNMVRSAAAENLDEHATLIANYEAIAAQGLAKRMKGRLFKPLREKTKKADAEFNNNLAQLDRLTEVFDHALVDRWLLEGKTEDEAADLLADHQQARAVQRAERNRAEFTKGKLASWMDKYANLPRKQKILYGIGAGAVIAAAGAGLAAAGGAFAVAGGIGVAAAKIGKTHFQQRSKIYATKNDAHAPKEITTTDADGRRRTAREQVAFANQQARSERETAIKRADVQKRVAVGVTALSAVAIGGGLLNMLTEHGGLGVHETVANAAMHPSPTAVDHADGYVDIDPPKAPVPAPALPEFSADAITMSDGEGFLETFQQVGVTDPAQQYALLNNQALMQELVRKGIAYPDATIGGYGLRMTPDHKVPVEALKLIKSYATRNGYDLAS